MSLNTIYLVDDDPAVLTALSRALRADGLMVETFQSAEEFLARYDASSPGCLVLDVTMPGLDGLALQRKLIEAGRSLPIVFVTGHGDIPMSVRAIKAGAADFLTKPVRAVALLAAVRAAMEHDMSNHEKRAELMELQRRLARLTARERQVLEGLTVGKLNKQIGADLGVVEQTVKFHRARIMERMQAKTFAELLHMTDRLGISAASPDTPASAHSSDAKST